MATIGLSKPFYAIYTASGEAVSYTSDGVLGKAVELSMELEGGDANILYADNGPAESATTFGGGTLTITTDDLLPEPAAAMLRQAGKMDKKQEALLLALKPFLRRERQEKIDRALQAARLASLASLALKNRGRSPGAKETP